MNNHVHAGPVVQADEDRHPPCFVRAVAYARAGLIGNPSDGYYGKTIAFTFQNFFATVILQESERLEIAPGPRDRTDFESIEALVQNVRRYGYYGGIRLLKAAIKRFWDYCRNHDIELPRRNFSLLYRSTIPDQVGLAGSSAIITACLRALMRFYGVTIPREQLPNLILSVETEELGIPAGLQDRVVQVYQGVVYMDFSRDYFQAHGYGRYEYLDAASLPPLYIAYTREAAQGTEIPHSDLRARFMRGDPEVLKAIDEWISLTEEMVEALKRRDWKWAGRLIDRNFDIRRRVMSLHPKHVQMVETARSVGLTAKFTGSGGAIVGTYEDESQLDRARELFRGLGVELVKPIIALPEGGTGQ